MKLEGIRLSETSQTKTNILYVEFFFKIKLIETEIGKWLPWAGGEGNGKSLVKGYKLSVIR